MSAPGPEVPPPPGSPYAGGSAGTPTCPRHPDRVSYVACQRCGRPTCFDCQRPAAVGVHCVDCVAQNPAPRVRTALGGPVGARPLVTYGVIALCALMFVLQAISYELTYRFLFAPVVGDTEPWRFITAGFLHSPPRGPSGIEPEAVLRGLMHIGFNCYALYIIGRVLEPVIGSLRYLVLYLISVLAGSVGYLLLSGGPGSAGWFTATVGASGGVFGLFAAFFVLSKRLNVDPRGILTIVLINAVIGFTVPGIAWQAHLGGLVGGGLAALVIDRTADRTRARWSWPGLAAIALGLVAVAVAYYLTLGADATPVLALH